MTGIAGEGRVAEWFKAPVLKTGGGSAPSWVRSDPFRHVAVKSMPCRQSSGPIVRQFDFCSLFRPPLGGAPIRFIGHSIARLIERYGVWAIGSSADWSTASRAVSDTARPVRGRWCSLRRQPNKSRRRVPATCLMHLHFTFRFSAEVFPLFATSSY